MKRTIGIAAVILLVALSSRAAPAVARTVTGATRLTGHVLPALEFATPALPVL